MSEETTTAKAESAMRGAMELWQRDVRFRRMIEAAFEQARFAREIGDEISESDLYEVAARTCALVLAKVYDDDGEIRMAHAERDHYKKLAEAALLLSPPAPVVVFQNAPASNSG